MESEGTEDKKESAEMGMEKGEEVTEDKGGEDKEMEVEVAKKMEKEEGKKMELAEVVEEEKGTEEQGDGDVEMVE